MAIFTFGPWEPVEGRNITVANSLSSPPCTKAVTFVKMAGLDYEETAAEYVVAVAQKIPPETRSQRGGVLAGSGGRIQNFHRLAQRQHTRVPHA